jgi:hypothetical protein
MRYLKKILEKFNLKVNNSEIDIIVDNKKVGYFIINLREII